jgi:hypothetical protein
VSSSSVRRPEASAPDRSAPYHGSAGASRGCGLFSALVFVKSSESHRAAFLLRKPATLEANADYKALTDGQRARCTLLTGDATKLEDVERAIDAVSGLDGIVDSLGGVPTMCVSWLAGPPL